MVANGIMGVVMVAAERWENKVISHTTAEFGLQCVTIWG